MAKQLSPFQPKGVRAKQLAETSLFSDANLVAYWKLDESSGNASDSKGTNTLTNNASATYSQGKFNNGVNLNGSSQYLSSSTIPQTGAGSFTASAWIKGSSFASDGAVIGWGTGSVSNGTTMDIRSGKMYADFYASGSVVGSTTMSTGIWYHVTYTWDGTNFRVYVNGVLDGTSGSIGGVNVTSSALAIGRAFWAAGNYFNGQIDDVAVFTRALSASEIQTLYFAGATKLYMPLNGNSVDISGNGNHGTDTAVSYVQGKFGQGARFNGSSSKIIIPASSFISSYTYSFWIKRNTSGQYGIISKDDGSSRYLSVLSDGSGNINGTVWLSTGTISISNLSIPNGVWNHICLSLDASSTFKVFLNGVLKETISISFGALTGSFATWFGADQFSGGRWYLDGMMDEIIYEDRAWTAQEVQAYYKKSMLDYKPKQSSLLSNFISYLLTATQQTYTLTGIATLFHFALRMFATVQTYTLTGIASLFKLGKGIVATVAGFTLTGNATNFTKALRMIGAVATYTLTGISATLIYIKQVIGGLGEFILTGNPVNFRFKGWTKTPKDQGGTWNKTPKN